MKGLQHIENQLYRIADSKQVKVVLMLMLCSYYYNLAVFRYSLTAQNELRLYDFVGILVIYQYLINKVAIDAFIRSRTYMSRLFDFIRWALVTMVLTMMISIVTERYIWILRTVLFMYHFLIFFFSHVFFLILMHNKKSYRQFIYAMIFLTIAASVIVWLQHMGVIGYLWSDVDKESYGGFFSGTLGPNKIVLGMVMFISSVTLMGVYFERPIVIRKWLLLLAILSGLLSLMLSGSRTSYVGILIFASYFFMRRTGRFLHITILIGGLVVALSFYDFEILRRIIDTVQGRVVDRISDPSQVMQGNVVQLYEDLGSGRKNLSLGYIKYLVSNPQVIPFGTGFNNYITYGASAHNIYLTLINEVGLVGLVLYIRWLFGYLYIDLRRFSSLDLSLKGMVLGMIVTLFFGEHLYVYRPVFGILGLFLFASAVLISPLYFKKDEPRGT